ncbi:MAG: hypothetical protein CL678_01175 [Bdellovibrionaceae bacterium]|nr:hypothetical protein [Pseudobdellovibrionaceae bacterium]|tara:strand:- start:923 stop:1804 length:882 start_codon:yes stop_codon:yes gene_type:complete
MDSDDVFLAFGLFFAISVGAITDRRGAALPVAVLGWAAWAARLYDRDKSSIRTIQAVIVAWCALGWGLNTEYVPTTRKSIAGVVLLVHIAAVVTSAAISSDRVIWDAVGDGSAGIFVLCHLPFSGAAWCGIEVYVLLAAAVLHEVDEVIQHLTWWSLLSLSFFDAIIALDAAGNQPRMADMFVGSFRVLTYTVAIGVIAMSILGCTLLSNAFDDNHPALYITGNFAMHYYPALRAAFAKSSCYDRTSATRAIAFVAAYAFLHDAPSVYGCSGFPTEVLPIAITGVSTLAAIVA